MKLIGITLLLFCGSFVYNCGTHQAHSHFDSMTDTKMTGITMVAPPQPFSSDPMPLIQKVNAQWVAFIPYGYSYMKNPGISYNTDWQWWGEQMIGVEESIRLAKRSGLKIMIKPQVYVPGGWIGSLDYANEQEWMQWEQDYKSYIMSYVQLAEKTNVEMLCIGTEIKVSVNKRPQFWKALISEIRSNYKGKLTYCANWDAYQNVPFWNELDYIGISAYFPLTDEKTPSVKLLKKQWKNIAREMSKFAEKQKKQILFTEYGYQSIDGCAGRAWEIEKDHASRDINQLAQANAIQAINESFENKKWWAGAFLWKWFPNMKGHEGYPKKDYTPQGKIAEEVLSHCYQKMN